MTGRIALLEKRRGATHKKKDQGNWGAALPDQEPEKKETVLRKQRERGVRR